MRTNMRSVLVVFVLLRAIYCDGLGMGEHEETDINIREKSDFDSILSHMRMVVKNGIKVKGTYSYSDGHARKTIYYIADDKGYRITGEDIMPLDDLSVMINKQEENIATKIVNKGESSSIDSSKPGMRQHHQQQTAQT